MLKVNDNFSLLPKKYLFSEVAARLREWREANPERELIRMDIGDVTIPLFPVVVEAMETACREMGTREKFHGYGPEQGYLFLREAVAKGDYESRGIYSITPEDIFISDGAKSDLGNIGDLFGRGTIVGVADPGYPVYTDANVIDGRTRVLLPCTPENGFKPEPPAGHVDVAILCSPGNPTGVCLNRDDLERWVRYARREGTLLIFDSAYEAYIREEDIPRSIYEIKGAEEVAIEIRSFSKTAGFTGLRCGYTVVPRKLIGVYSDGTQVSLNELWNRRQTTKFNGASYIVQRGAEALYTMEGKGAVRVATETYLDNARLLARTLRSCGLTVYGGENSPYVWARREGPEDSGAWGLFNELLEHCGVSSTPGAGFGRGGEGYIRLTGFASPANTREASARLKEYLTL